MELLLVSVRGRAPGDGERRGRGEGLLPGPGARQGEEPEERGDAARGLADYCQSVIEIVVIQ